MRHISLRRELPYSREAMFDLAADIERYPEFLPGFLDSRVLRREGERLLVEQRIGAAGLTYRFQSEAVLDRPTRIHVRSGSFPFRRLDEEWRFEPRDGGCLVIFEADYELRSALVQSLLSRFFDDALSRTLGAFVDRAHRLYGR